MTKPLLATAGKGFENSALEGTGKLSRRGRKINPIPTVEQLAELVHTSSFSDSVLDRIRQELFPPPILSAKTIKDKRLERERRREATRSVLRRQEQ